MTLKILLTGAQGQVGREVLALATPALEIFPYAKADLDIRELQKLRAVVELHRPAVVINTAAYTAVDKAEQEQDLAYAVNRDGVKNLALVCKELDIPLIHVSTDYVFDGGKAGPYVETDARAPLNHYGASKAEGEKVLQETWEKHFILRVSWVFGQYGHNFVKTILRLAAERPQLRIVADQVGYPTAASDLAKTLLILAERAVQKNPHWGIFHYRGDRPVSWFDFAKTILKHDANFQMEKLQPITTAEFPTPAKRPQNSLLAMDKIQKTYGIAPSAWERELERILKHTSL